MWHASGSAILPEGVRCSQLQELACPASAVRYESAVRSCTESAVASLPSICSKVTTWHNGTMAQCRNFTTQHNDIRYPHQCLQTHLRAVSSTGTPWCAHPWCAHPPAPAVNHHHHHKMQVCTCTCTCTSNNMKYARYCAARCINGTPWCAQPLDLAAHHHHQM